MNINSAFPSSYVKACDLQGQPVTVTMREIAIEDVSGDGTEAKPVLYFQGMSKGLVLNKTNAATIAGAYGEETDHWRGQSLTIFPTTTLFKGQMTECIRVRIDHAPAPVPVQPVAIQPPAASGGVKF